MEPMFLDIKLSDWFSYHPPKTEQRKRKHEVVGEICLGLAQEIERSAMGDDFTWGVACANFEENILDQVGEEKQASAAIRGYISKLIAQLRSTFNPLDRMFLIQQVRMFANQAITFESL